MIKRVELKFMLNYEEYKILRRKLSLILDSDEFATYDNSYYLSSLYYDDMYDSATYDKADGVEYHRKFRIRTYENGNKKLEYKTKNGTITTKQTLNINQDFEKILINRDFDEIKKHIEEPLINDLFIKMKVNDLRPRLYVDYLREAYVFNKGDVRITFDKDILAYNCYNVNNKYKILEPRKLIMEVKYSSYLPDYIRKIIFQKNYQTIPYSKYLMCWLKINNWGV